MTRATEASQRLRRLVAMVPWLAADPSGRPLPEVLDRFGVTRAQLEADLLLLTYVGVPPYSPDALFEIFIDEDRVTAFLTPVLDRPLSLTRLEALALILCGQVLEEDPFHEPGGALSRAIAKVAKAAGVETEVQLAVDVGSSDPVLAALREACEAGMAVELDYYSQASDERTRRRVDPVEVRYQDGGWYLAAYDHLREEPRTFRVERVAAVEVLEEPVQRRDAPAAGFVAPAGAARVVLDLDADAGWVIETVPTEEVADLGDGRRRVTITVASAPWFARLLLRLGPTATVVDAPAGLVEAAAEAARLVLERHRAPAGTTGPFATLTPE